MVRLFSRLASKGTGRRGDMEFRTLHGWHEMIERITDQGKGVMQEGKENDAVQLSLPTLSQRRRNDMVEAGDIDEERGHVLSRETTTFITNAFSQSSLRALA